MNGKINKSNALTQSTSYYLFDFRLGWGSYTRHRFDIKIKPRTIYDILIQRLSIQSTYMTVIFLFIVNLHFNQMFQKKK